MAALRASVNARIASALTATGSLAILVVAAGLRPSPTGMGTHKQLGLPSCGWIAAGGVPCPSCGMTTAFSAAANADPVAALIAQPMGLAAAIGCSVVLWGSLHTAVFGSRVGEIALRGLRPRVLALVGVLWLVSWMYKIAAHQAPGL